MKRVDLNGIIASLKHPRVAWVGIRTVRDRTVHRQVRDGKPQDNALDLGFGAMVEVLAQGQFGYCATPDMSVEGLKRAFERATHQALAAARYAVHSFTPDARPPSTGRYASTVQEPFAGLSAGDLNHLLIKACEAMKQGDAIAKVSADALLIDKQVSFVSSNGADFEQEFTIGGLSLQAIASEGGLVQKRSNGGGRAQTFQRGAEIFSPQEVLAQAHRVGAEALELLRAPNCPTGAMDLVLAPNQMMLQIHESIGHPLELDRILGDERNYAGSSFVKLEDIGSLAYGSELLNVTFDPTLPDEVATYAYDDTGVPAEKVHLIEHGRLVRALGSLESQTRARKPGVANARATSWNRAPIDRMANINIEPGDSGFAEIVSGIERGVFMESNSSWSIDDYRLKFQFGCEYARIIENGALGGVVRNPNYRGVTTDFWHKLFRVGDAATFQVWGVPNCGKGEPNQVMLVGHAAPVCAFKDIEVFGGER